MYTMTLFLGARLFIFSFTKLFEVFAGYYPAFIVAIGGIAAYSYIKGTLKRTAPWLLIPAVLVLTSPLTSPSLVIFFTRAQQVAMKAMAFYYLVFSLVLLIILAYMENKAMAPYFVRMCNLKTAGFLLVAGIGAYLGGVRFFVLPNILHLISALIAVFFMRLHSILLKDKKEYKTIGPISALIALAFGILAGWVSVLLVAAFLLIFYLPIRFRNSISSPLTIGIGSMLCYFLGYFTMRSAGIQQILTPETIVASLAIVPPQNIILIGLSVLIIFSLGAKLARAKGLALF
jgi:hypothetical protein